MRLTLEWVDRSKADCPPQYGRASRSLLKACTKRKTNSMKDIPGSVRKTGVQRYITSKYYINIKFTEIEAELRLCKRISLFLENTNRKD